MIAKGRLIVLTFLIVCSISKFLLSQDLFREVNLDVHPLSSNQAKILNALQTVNAYNTGRIREDIARRRSGRKPPSLTSCRKRLRSIYNLKGERLRALVKAAQTAGRHDIRWDGRNDRGAAVASGVYLARIEAGRKVEVRKMTLVR